MRWPRVSQRARTHTRSECASNVARSPSLGDEAFDLVTAFDVLEHIPDDRAAVAELVRALRPGGTLLVHVPRDQWTTRSGVVHRVPDDEAWRINPGHVRQGYDPDGLRGLLGSAGLSVVQIQLWVGRWGTLAHDVYSRLEHPAPLRLLSIPVTEICGRLDRRGTRIERQHGVRTSHEAGWHRASVVYPRRPWAA